LIRNFYFILLFNLASSQVRIGEFQSLSSYLNIYDIELSKDFLLYISNSGFIEYDYKEKFNNAISVDQGLTINDLNEIHIDIKGNYWIGSNNGIMVWGKEEKKLKAEFEIGIEKLTGFIDFNNLIYASVKLNGQWGLVEFIYNDDKIYYRDFYKRNDINDISKIIEFNDNIYIISSNKILSGNPFKEHITYWANPLFDINDDVVDFSSDENSLFILTKNAIYQLHSDNSTSVFFENNLSLGSIKLLSASSNNLFAISDTSIFQINKNKLTHLFTDPSLVFNDIKSDSEVLWLGTDYGLAKYSNSLYENLLFNQALINSSDIIEISNQGQLILASAKGISLSGWNNYSTQIIPAFISDNFNISKIDYDFGKKISKSIFNNSTLYLSMIESSSAGILSFDITGNELNLVKRYYPIESQNSNSSEYTVEDIVIDSQDNLWASSSGNYNYPLSVFTNNQSRYFPANSAQNNIIRRGSPLVVDNYNRLWLFSLNGLLMYKYSGNILDPQSEKWVSEPIVEGVNRRPLSFGISKNNTLWILTELGLIFKELKATDSDPVAETGPITSSGNISPYFSNIPFDENSIIRFDPRGNIWITSKQDGIFVLDTNRDYWPNIEGINSSNSSLISNEISDIKFDADLGLAYIATNLGVSKFKIPFALEIDQIDQIDIFPSPFRIPSKYPLTINGVPEQSSIQIMTLNGTIVKTLNSNEINGYQAVWNGVDMNGRSVGSGIYLVLIISKKHKINTMKKLAVIKN
tara:strand:- start:4352 stop:6601 length:2250 start_codon:yes stop_codon:yes gene_type:complete